VRLPRPSARLLVELCHDPLFLLAGASFRAGGAAASTTWEFDPLLLAELQRPVWLRAVDLDDPHQVELGRWRHAPAPRPPFNRLLRSLAEERARPEYQAAVGSLARVVEELRSAGLAVRLDRDREWEHAHVLLALARLAAVETVLDVGGGNAPLAYLLARREMRVTMLDVDREAVATTASNARRLALGGLTAVHVARGPWPVAADSIDAVVCVSVIEGVLMKDRPAFWGEIRRVLRPDGRLFLTFDFGPDARFVGDPPLTLEDVERDLVRASGLELVGEPIRPVDFGLAGPPVRAEAAAANGTRRAIAYTFGALELRKPPAARRAT
jgi:SAM-dependent methyltransferase